MAQASQTHGKFVIGNVLIILAVFYLSHSFNDYESLTEFKVDEHSDGIAAVSSISFISSKAVHSFSHGHLHSIHTGKTKGPRS